MRKLSAINAMNSDDGASSGLVMNGNYITTPGCQIGVTLLEK
ncbi:MAG TPA: hypothetical protein VNR38_11550 [Ureibacillus sp.]|nr:hypothetical protein [Ureibacillus sp.]